MRSNEGQPAEVGTIARCIARQQPIFGNGCMSADEEVRQSRTLLSTSTAVIYLLPVRDMIASVLIATISTGIVTCPLEVIRTYLSFTPTCKSKTIVSLLRSGCLLKANPPSDFNVARTCAFGGLKRGDDAEAGRSVIDVHVRCLIVPVVKHVRRLGAKLKLRSFP